MGIKTTYLRQFVIFLAVCLFLTLLFTQRTLAANGVITVSPQTGNYTNGQTFNVSIGINGGGTAFNAAKATVAVSAGLSIQSVTIGDCNFAFVKTPTQTDPSFVGVILGGSTQACTVYELKLKAVSSETTGIILFDAAVTSYKGAQKIPLSIQYGRYSITGTAPATTQPSPIETPALGTGGISLYDILFTFPQPKNTPLSGLKVVLDPTLSQKRTVVPTSTSVTFDNVPEGVHTIATLQDDKPLSKQIVNVSGNNKNIAFGVGAQKPTPVWMWYALASIIFICLGILGASFYRRYRRWKPPNL